MDKIMLGMRIRQARERNNLMSEQLAERIGLRPTSLDAIEKGSKVPKIDTFVAIVKTLGVTCDELLIDSLGSSFLKYPKTDKTDEKMGVNKDNSNG